jgi:hypothetical protein
MLGCSSWAKEAMATALTLALREVLVKARHRTVQVALHVRPCNGDWLALRTNHRAAPSFPLRRPHQSLRKIGETCEELAHLHPSEAFYFHTGIVHGEVGSGVHSHPSACSSASSPNASPACSGVPTCGPTSVAPASSLPMRSPGASAVLRWAATVPARMT